LKTHQLHVTCIDEYIDRYIYFGLGKHT